MSILVVGLSQKTAPVEIRERHALTPASLGAVLSHFDATNPHPALNPVGEGAILSTCHRLEVYACVRYGRNGHTAIIDWLSDICGSAPDVLGSYMYVHHDESAVRHLMRVAAGLDSMVLGEAQILGQISDAYALAQAHGTAGRVLSPLFRAAIHAGKRVRTETGIGTSSASVGSLAASLASRVLGDLPQRQILLIGAGEMATLALKALAQRGATNIVVANRTPEHAERLAQTWRGAAIAMDRLPTGLAGADIVITSTGAPHHILERSLLEPIMIGRPDRPLFIIDIAMPRDVAPEVASIPGVHLCNIDDLKSQAEENIRLRASEIPLAETIVAEEVAQFMEWHRALAVSTTVADLHAWAGRIRERELERLLNRLDLDEHGRKLVSTMSHRVVRSILHEPTVSLKRLAADGECAEWASVVRQLFSLDNADEGD